MNRRQLIKTVAATGLGVMVAPQLVKAQSKSGDVLGCDPTCAPPGPSLPSPPDTRTPEQVWEDWKARELDWLDTLVNLNDGYKGVYFLALRQYVVLRNRMIERGKEIVTRTFDGQECILINGNIITVQQ